MNAAYSTHGQYIHSSILNADFMSIGTELDKISTADSVHVDVMDNHFVPNLTSARAWSSRSSSAARSRSMPI